GSCAMRWAKASTGPTPISPPRWPRPQGGAERARPRGRGQAVGIGDRGTMAEPIYRRGLVKGSGEALMGPGGFGIHQPTLERIAADLAASHALGVAIGLVVGGGNIFRGVKVSEQGIPRVTADLMGILATVMNALALESAIERAGMQARVMSALA